MTNSTSHAPDMISSDDADGVPAPLSARSREIAGAAAGAAIGSALGVLGGPLGMIAGALVGAAVGALSERAVQKATVEAERTDAALDAEIGVSGGDIGAPSLRDPSRAFGERRMSEVDFFGDDELSRAAANSREERLAA